MRNILSLYFLKTNGNENNEKTADKQNNQIHSDSIFINSILQFDSKESDKKTTDKLCSRN